MLQLSFIRNQPPELSVSNILYRIHYQEDASQASTDIHRKLEYM